jgi:hypothetical protein
MPERHNSARFHPNRGEKRKSAFDQMRVLTLCFSKSHIVTPVALVEYECDGSGANA